MPRLTEEQVEILRMLEQNECCLVRKGSRWVVEGEEDISISHYEMRDMEVGGFLMGISKREQKEDEQPRRLTGSAYYVLKHGVLNEEEQGNEAR